MSLLAKRYLQLVLAMSSHFFHSGVCDKNLKSHAIYYCFAFHICFFFLLCYIEATFLFSFCRIVCRELNTFSSKNCLHFYLLSQITQLYPSLSLSECTFKSLFNDQFVYLLSSLFKFIHVSVCFLFD